jgi:replicative DNA helicase Mcm
MEYEEKIVNKFVNFFEEYTNDSGERVYLQELLKTVKRKQKSIQVNWIDLHAFDPELAEDLIKNPSEIIPCAEDAVQILLHEHLSDYEVFPRVHVRFYNVGVPKLPHEVELRDANHLIQVEGIITRISEAKPFVEKAVFVCKDCGNEMIRLQKPYEPLVKPPKCDLCGSKNIELDTDKSRLVYFQSFRLQDPPEVSREILPSFLDGILLDDLANSAVPGQRVRLTGVLRVIPDYRNKHSVTLKEIFEVNNIEIIQKDWDEEDITNEDIRRFREEAKRSDFKERVIRSIAPSVHGHENVKEGLLLALLGGYISEEPSGDLGIRDRIHVLMAFEDPTIGSQLLEFIYKIAPKPVLVREGTGANLTILQKADKITGGKVIEAGATVLATGGTVLLEGFEKISHLEYISTVIKNGEIVLTGEINIVIPAKSTIIASSRPKSGRVDLEKEPLSQIFPVRELSSYFGLIYLILDRPKTKLDGELADYVLRLQMDRNAQRAPYGIDFLRKFIAYAKNMKPKLSQEAAEYLKQYYLKLRREYAFKRRSGEMLIPIHISILQLYTLVNLTIAHAKLHLRSTATAEDARAAVKIFERAYETIGISVNPEENLMNLIKSAGRKRSKENVLEALIDVIKQLENETKYGAPKDLVINKAVELNLDENEIVSMLNELFHEGRIYEPRSGYYKTIS